MRLQSGSLNPLHEGAYTALPRQQAPSPKTPALLSAFGLTFQAFTLWPFWPLVPQAAALG